MKIENYQIQLFAGGKKQELKAFIWLFDDLGDAVGSLQFFNSKEELPDHDTISESGFVSSFLPYSSYSDVIDLLRNEEPVFLRYEESHKTGYLTTSQEPVGEGEFHLQLKK